MNDKNYQRRYRRGLTVGAVGDPAAPWGYKMDGTPKQKPGRRPAANYAPQRLPGPSVVDALEAEVEEMDPHRLDRTTVAMGFALARTLDDPTCQPQHANCANRLNELLDRLRGKAEGGQSRLAALRETR